MNKILLSEKEILEYIKYILHDLNKGYAVVHNAKYHHNANYCDAVSICKNGILTMSDLKKTGIKNFNDKIFEKMEDIESHINGIDGVSLSVVGLEDLYPGEFEYNPLNPTQVDFLVTSDIKCTRNSTHYGNEFLSYKNISVDELRTIDIRILKLVDLIERNSSQKDYTIKSVVQKYNFLKEIAIMMQQTKLDIPLREMSTESNMSLDIDKLSTTPSILLKK